MINYDDLEDWSMRAVQLLQDIADEAQAAAGDPDGDQECPDIRALLDEHNSILEGKTV